MANAQGEIAGTLYARGYAPGKNMVFAMHDAPVVDKDGMVPMEGREIGARPQLIYYYGFQ